MARRLLIVSRGAGVCLILQALLWVGAVQNGALASKEATLIGHGIFHLLDIVSLCLLSYLFHPGITRARKDEKERKSKKKTSARQSHLVSRGSSSQRPSLSTGGGGGNSKARASKNTEETGIELSRMPTLAEGEEGKKNSHYEQVSRAESSMDESFTEHDGLEVNV